MKALIPRNWDTLTNYIAAMPVLAIAVGFLTSALVVIINVIR